MSFIAPSRLEAFERVKQWQKNEENTSPIVEYMKGILETDFFATARNNPDSSAAKRLNFLWDKDRCELRVQEDSKEVWIEFFRMSVYTARVIPRLK